jgi:riboflavin kinase / FMN adenylyltransferase
MKVYEGLEQFIKLEKAVVTSGTFDGVHVGHQKILQRLDEIAHQNSGETVLITFWPHPRLVLYPEQPLRLLSSIDEKIELLARLGVDHLIILPFTRDFAALSSEQFVKEILVDRIGTKKLVIGYNHRFGHNREGSFEVLKQDAPIYGFEVEEIPKQMVEHVGVSSTKIRRALEEGLIEVSNEFLGRPYNLRGEVKAGERVGRTLGFPTANLHVSFEQKLIPADGIYAVRVVLHGKVYEGMLNIGFRPTFKGTIRRLEVNILDFDQEIYGEELNVLFYRQIRREIRFDSAEALKHQLNRDKSTVREVLAKIPPY